MDFKFIILGGGMVAGHAAKQMVESGLQPGMLAIVSADTSLPYERPPLSKGFLAGKDSEASILINSEDFYRQHRIEVQLSCEVIALDAQRKRLTLKSGEELGFEKLIIATGARPRTLTIPGARLRNVHYLRSLTDSKSIRDSAPAAKHAAVIGGGFIGMEVAAVLAQKGIQVSMIFPDERIWKRLFTPRMSNFFEGYYTARSVQFFRGSKVAEVRGTAAVESVALAGGQTIPCEMVVAGVGVEPATEMLANSGILLGNGVLVNEYLETNQPGIYVAGDIANYVDVLFSKRRRVEHWDNAVAQGQYCGRALIGQRTPFRHVPYFFSDVFDLSYEYWGDSSEADQIIERGDLSTSSFSVWWLRQNRLVAAFTMNRPDEERQVAPKWIEEKAQVSGAKLKDASKPISTAQA